jgi:hypothetical protein
MSTNEEVVHNWANQTGRKRNSNSMHYEGASLYSYNTEIARLMADYVISTSQRYSTTTSTKHQSIIGAAVSHIEHFSFNEHMRDLSNDWELAKFQILESYYQTFKAELERLKRARSRIAFELECLSHLADKIVILQMQCDGVTDNYKDLSLAPDTASRVLIICNDWNFDFTKKLAKELEANATHAEEIKKRAELEALKEAEKIQMWRKGEYNYSLYACPVMLRCLDGETVETSHGARVQLETAKAAFEALTLGSSIIGTCLDGFTVLEVTKEHIKVGCHTIPFAEVATLFGSHHI